MLSKRDWSEMNTTPLDRQKEFERIVADALVDPNLKEALQAFEMGEQEYLRAIAGSTVTKIFTGNTSNPKDNTHADLDTDQS